jgi:HSP20 family protein
MMTIGVWQPRADVYRFGERWFVKLELAGIQVNDIDVSAYESTLSVRGIRRDILLDENPFYHSLEISYSHFERKVNIPFNIEPSSICWEYNAGMLLIQLERATGSELL